MGIWVYQVGQGSICSTASHGNSHFSQPFLVLLLVLLWQCLTSCFDLVDSSPPITQNSIDAIPSLLRPLLMISQVIWAANCCYRSRYEVSKGNPVLWNQPLLMSFDTTTWYRSYHTIVPLTPKRRSFPKPHALTDWLIRTLAEMLPNSCCCL